MRVKLTKRLKAVADFVSPGSRVIDVGTDHAYVPVWLLQEGIAVGALACDIAPGPLSRARQTAEEADIREGISFVLTDGLRGLGPEDGDTVIMAGMGGETIISILSEAPWTISCKLIIQPQSKLSLLESWLCDRGYRLSAAVLVKDSGRIYPVMYIADEKQGETALELFRKNNDPLLREYLDGLIRKHEKMVAGMERSAGSGELDGTRKALGEYKKLREELS
ncbi:MAG: SAM-dependent methyltransferase [Oscillospiraceae bacterium]|nr:SAM-dependent methyltransferase [Oscillospiraceae bacterium]